MDIFIFFMRYIPFWAVPLFLIALQFTYIYWLKSIKPMAYLFIFVGIMCLGFNIFYFYMGGGENVAVSIQNLIY
ncbi:MAG: hypothetical protein CME61_03020 [Halobacteriovoraceae bacterium]|nr:hypothetical protein [Halobacteriovoraceae bacterium]